MVFSSAKRLDCTGLLLFLLESVLTVASALPTLVPGLPLGNKPQIPRLHLTMLGKACLYYHSCVCFPT